MKTLSLSIVIPVHNEEDHIESCLDAIAAQTVMPDEVIVVDNNCTDATVTIAQQYPFVKIIREVNQGIGYARSAGFDAVQTDLIGRIDADTILPVNWVEEARMYLQDRPEELLTGGCYMYDLGFPRFSGWITEYFSFRVNRLIIGSFIAWGSNLVLWRHQWEEVRDSVSHDTSIHEDIDLGILLSRRGHHITYQSARKVGVDSKIFSEQRRTRKQQFIYLKRWPNTLQHHKLRRAWLGVVGAYVVYSLYYPLQITHRLGKLLALRQRTSTESPDL